MRTIALALFVSTLSMSTLSTRAEAAPVDHGAMASPVKPPRLYQRVVRSLVSLLPGHAEPLTTLGKIEPAPQPAGPQTRRTGYTRTVDKKETARWQIGTADRKTVTITEKWTERPVQPTQRIAVPGGYAGRSPKEALWSRIAAVRARLETATPTMRRALLPLLAKVLEEVQGVTVSDHDTAAKFEGKTMRVYTTWDSRSDKLIRISFRDMGTWGGSEFAEIELNPATGHLTFSDKKTWGKIIEAPVSATEARIERVTNKSRDLPASRFQKELDASISSTVEPAK